MLQYKMKISCALFAVCFLSTVSGSFLKNVSPNMGHGFWQQFQHGLRQFEDAAREEAGSLEGALKSWLGHDSGSQEDDRETFDTDFSGPDFSSPVDVGFHDGLFNMFRGGNQAWWKGPNVCVEREEIDENQHKNGTDGQNEDDNIFGSFQFSSCQQTEIKYICTTKIRNHGIRKTFVVKYQCCHGFRRIPSKPGCSEVNLKGLMETTAAVGASDFVELVRSAGLEEKMSASNLTLFAPSDDAIRDFTDSMQEANQVEFYIPPASARRRRSMEGTSMREIILGHMTEGFHDISEIVNEQVLYSDNNNSTIHLNIYPVPGERLVTANCARLTSINNYATNGIVHVVDRVIRPVVKSLAELIAQDDQFTILKTMLGKADLLKKLSEPGHLTLFAPTDSAFEKMDPSVHKRLMQADTCIGNVLRHHLLPHTLCSAAISAKVLSANLAGNILTIERRPDDGKLFIGDVQIVVKDIIATNGIVHVLDEVLMPDSGRPVSGVLSSHNLTTFLGLLNDAGLTDSIDTMNNVTLFAPTDAALAKPEAVAVLDSVRGDKDRLRDLLLYHTTGPEVQACDLSNNQELKTGLADKSIRINLYSTMPFFSGHVNRATVQCAQVMNFDSKACGGVVHEVDRLLVPPTQSVQDLLDTMGNYTTLIKLIKHANLEAELKENAPFTLLAPTDEVFNKLEEEVMKRLLDDSKLAARVLRQHVLPELLCCSGVGATSWPFINRVETLSGHSVSVRRDHEGEVHIGSTTVQDCDNMATNGVIHSVNRVMVPHQETRRGQHLQKFRNPNVEVFLYGL